MTPGCCTELLLRWQATSASFSGLRPREQVAFPGQYHHTLAQRSPFLNLVSRGTTPPLSLPHYSLPLVPRHRDVESTLLWPHKCLMLSVSAGQVPCFSTQAANTALWESPCTGLQVRRVTRRTHFCLSLGRATASLAPLVHGS